MKIAFVSGNREKLPDAVVPLGLLNVMAATPERHEKVLVDLCFEPRPVEALAERLSSEAPDLVAIGMRNIQRNDYSGQEDNIAYYRELVETARAATGVPVLVGGSGFSVMPAPLLEALGVDYGISGEGEEAFPRLVEALESGEPPAREALDAVGNLHHWIDGGVVSSPPPARFLDMDALPVPSRALLDPRYYARYGIESVQTKRGCPLRCDYCTYPLIEGRIGRTRSPVAVVDEMFQLAEEQPGIRHFFLVDSVFNLPRAHAKAVCRELIAREWSIPWTCYANPLGFDAEMAELAHAAGCAGMEIGSDSGCDEVLDRLRKGFHTHQIRDLHSLCKRSEVPDCHTFILGTMGESLDDVRRSLDFIVELDPFAAIIMVWVDDLESLDPPLRRERTRFRETIFEILREQSQRFPYWIVPALGINFDSQLFRRLRRNGLHGPLWQHIRALPGEDSPESGRAAAAGGGAVPGP